MTDTPVHDAMRTVRRVLFDTYTPNFTGWDVDMERKVIALRDLLDGVDRIITEVELDMRGHWR